jgi:hypothetical protein
MLAYDSVDQQGTATSLLIPFELPFMISCEVSRRPLAITLLGATKQSPNGAQQSQPAPSGQVGSNHQELQANRSHHTSLVQQEAIQLINVLDHSKISPKCNFY